MSEDIEKIRVRFYELTTVGEGCWPWIGYINKGGYGKIFFRGRLESAHRVSYMLAHNMESLPESCVLHACDNSKCVRPDHLFLGTQLDNIKDMNSKGRHWNTKKTHCKNGHPLSGENLVINASGSRSCRICVKHYFKFVYKQKPRTKKQSNEKT